MLWCSPFLHRCFTCPRETSPSWNKRWSLPRKATAGGTCVLVLLTGIFKPAMLTPGLRFISNADKEKRRTSSSESSSQEAFSTNLICPSFAAKCTNPRICLLKASAGGCTWRPAALACSTIKSDRPAMNALFLQMERPQTATANVSSTSKAHCTICKFSTITKALETIASEIVLHHCLVVTGKSSSQKFKTCWAPNEWNLR